MTTPIQAIHHELLEDCHAGCTFHSAGGDLAEPCAASLTPAQILDALATDAMHLSARLLHLRDAAMDPATRATLDRAYLDTERVYLDLSALRDATAIPSSQEAA